MNLPLTMQGRVTDCVQLTYRTPAKTVQHLLPDGLELLKRGPWAFWNVMLCRVEKLRPAGVPAFCGVTYHHAAYRLRVQAMNDSVEVIGGLYFTRSDVDAIAVSVLGNKLTDFRLHPAALAIDTDDGGVRVSVKQTDYAQGDLDLVARHTPGRLAADSCFPTTEDARRFCRYTPNGLAVVEQDGRRMLRVSRVQRAGGAWSETPLAVQSQRLAYFDTVGQDEHAKLEWACRLSTMDYRWQIGETVALLNQPRRTPVLERVAV